MPSPAPVGRRIRVAAYDLAVPTETAAIERGTYLFSTRGTSAAMARAFPAARFPPADWPAAPNLTPGEGRVMPRYADAQALRAKLRQGKRPDRTVVTVIPFDSFKNITDTNVAALHLYLKSPPPRPAGAR